MGITQFTPSPLKIRGAFTWHTGTHQLFDYDNNNQAQTIIYPPGSGFLQRKGLELQYSALENDDWETLFELEQSRGKLVKVIDNSSSKQQKEQLWMVLQRDCSFILNEGDVLKLGKMVVTIKEIVLNREQSECTMMQTKIGEINEKLDIVEARSACSGVSKKTGAPQCRICFDSHDDEDDPLIQPCSCSGTLGRIHLNCLKEWLQNKITKKISEISFSYNWGRLKCQICGQRFEETYWKHGKEHWIIPIVQKPEPPYMVLESYKTHNTFTEDEDASSIVYITQLTQNLQVKIGRDNTQHIRINDISVSRSHCSFTLIHGRLIVSDKSSKFGTLIRFKNPTVVATNSISLQYGRTNIQIGRQNDFFGCCLECIEGQEFLLCKSNQ